MAKLERDFQRKLIKTLYAMFEGCLVLKNDPNYIQGIPDLLVLYKDRWAALECKREEKSHHQPNQDFYIDKMDKMSFARFICPENQEEVLHELQHTFESDRSARLSRGKSVPLDQLRRGKTRRNVYSMEGEATGDRAS